MTLHGCFETSGEYNFVWEPGWTPYARSQIGLPIVAIATLIEELQQAKKELQRNGREAAMAALRTIIPFLDLLPGVEEQDLTLPLWQLLAGLQDLEQGRVVGMLQPNPEVHHRKPESSSRRIVKACAAACTDGLRRAGVPLDEACRFIAVVLERSGFPIRNRIEIPSWKTVKSWRARLSKLQVNDQERLVVDALRREAPIGPFGSAEAARWHVSRLLPRVIMELGKPALE